MFREEYPDLSPILSHCADGQLVARLHTLCWLTA
jgi:hypothetical protein